MDQKQAEFFNGGVPYALDIQRLQKHFPSESLVEGRVIKHEEFETVLDIQNGSSRYYGVIDTWRAKLKSSIGLVLEWDRGVGLAVLDPGGVLEHTESKTKQKAKQLGKAVKEYRFVDRSRLDPMGQRRLDHQMAIGARLAQAAAASTKEMAVELTPIQVMPKRPLPVDVHKSA